MKLTGRRRVFGVMGMLGVAAACIAVQSGVCLIGWPAQPERAAAVAAANDGSLLTLPFELASNKIYMQTTVNGKGPFPFVLDTGAPYTVLDWDLAEGNGGANLLNQLPFLLTNGLYINAHTPEFPAGAIRGQIVVTDVVTVPEPNSGAVFAVAALAFIGLYVGRRAWQRRTIGSAIC